MARLTRHRFQSALTAVAPKRRLSATTGKACPHRRLSRAEAPRSCEEVKSPHAYSEWLFLVAAACLATLAGCGKAGDGPAEPTPDNPFHIVLQTDWFAQPEHGGFYQALEKGYYREAGLDVEILEGGPNAMSVQKVLSRRAHFAMNRADTVMTFVKRGMPVVMVMATLQHDPQGILLHADDPAQTVEDLDGRRVMAVPGLAWIAYVERKYNITLDIIPHDFGMERFLADPRFIQQCLVTNEPYYMEKHGAEVRVLRLADTGFNPYHGIYCHRDFAEARPDIVRRFVDASIRGWTDFIEGDPAPAFAAIAARNPKMTPGFMAYARDRLVEDRLVTGFPERDEAVGRLDPERMRALRDELHALGILDERLPLESFFTDAFLRDVP